MFSKFDINIQSDELSAAELYEAQAEWEAQQEEELSDFDPHRDFYAEMDDEAYEWTEEAIAWEEGMRSDNLYDDEDFDDIDDNELYNDPYNGEPFEDTYNDYDAWEAYCDYE